jgi:threonine/homoserine/homoserine lactone efflux protein
MPDPSSLALFVGAALLLLIVPGPSVLYIVTQSVAYGRRAGLVSVAGITTGTLVHILAATVGLSALLASSAFAFDVVKYLGAAYLVFVGLRRLAGLEPDDQPHLRRTRDLGRLYRQGIVVNTLNPKTALFFLAFLPQFVLGLLFAALGFLSDGAWALATGTLGERLRRSRRFPLVQRYVSGSVFVGLGAVAALSGPAKSS